MPKSCPNCPNCPSTIYIYHIYTYIKIKAGKVQLRLWTDMEKFGQFGILGKRVHKK